MLGNDIVGFQTPEHGRSFLYTCQAYVPDAVVDYSTLSVRWQYRRIEVTYHKDFSEVLGGLNSFIIIA